MGRPRGPALDPCSDVKRSLLATHRSLLDDGVGGAQVHSPPPLKRTPWRGLAARSVGLMDVPVCHGRAAVVTTQMRRPGRVPPEPHPHPHRPGGGCRRGGTLSHTFCSSFEVALQ